MLPQLRPHGRLRLPALAVWSLAAGLAWLLLGQQLAGQPGIHLDLTAGLPGAPPVHDRQGAPARSAPTLHRQAPPTSPRSSTGTSPQRSPGTSPQQPSPRSSTGTSPGTPPRNSQAAARAVAFALAQQGKPYVFGAEGPGAYDCSGLTWLAWQHGGLAWAPMSAAGQWQWLHQRGQDAPVTQLRARALLFYANDPHDPASIHYVAMAIGDRRMIEAPAPGIPVREVPVRWDGLFAAARPVT